MNKIHVKKNYTVQAAKMHHPGVFIRTAVKVSLYTIGVFENKNCRSAYFIAHVCLSVFLILGTIIGSITNHNLFDRIEILSISVSLTTTLALFVEVFTSRTNIMKLLIKMKKKKQYTEQIIHQTDVIVREKGIKIVILLLLMATLSIAPPIFFSLHDTAITDKYSLVLPFWYSCGDGENQVIFQVLCRKVNTKVELMISNMIQLSITTMTYVPCIAPMLLYSVTIIELLMHVNVFKYQTQQLTVLMNMYETVSHSGPITHRQEMEKSLYEELIEQDFLDIIKYQQYLKSCVLDITVVWSRYSSIFVTDYLIIGAVLSYMAVTEGRNEIIFAIRAGSVNLFVLLILLLLCYYSQVIQDLNDEIFDEVCTIPWYQQSIKFRKSYSIVLSLNRKSTHMKVFGILILNLNTILVILKRGYSIFNLMLLKNK